MYHNVTTVASLSDAWHQKLDQPQFGIVLEYWNDVRLYGRHEIPGTTTTTDAGPLHFWTCCWSSIHAAQPESGQLPSDWPCKRDPLMDQMMDQLRSRPMARPTDGPRVWQPWQQSLPELKPQHGSSLPAFRNEWSAANVEAPCSRPGSTQQTAQKIPRRHWAWDVQLWRDVAKRQHAPASGDLNLAGQSDSLSPQGLQPLTWFMHMIHLRTLKTMCAVYCMINPKSWGDSHRSAIPMTRKLMTYTFPEFLLAIHLWWDPKHGPRSWNPSFPFISKNWIKGRFLGHHCSSWEESKGLNP